MAQPPKAAAGGTSPCSPFQEAVKEFLQALPKKSKKTSFVVSCMGAAATPEHVHQSIVKVEEAAADKPATRIIRRTLEPIIGVLEDYSGIIDSLCQADPMPTALVWGCLKAVVECSRRFLGLYTTIRSQLHGLTYRLSRLTDYYDLFGSSLVMLEVLKSSYVNILRFWCRVERECNRCVLDSLFKTVTSLNTKKLNDILADLDKDADNIDKLVPIVQERMSRGERENAAEERRKAGISRQELTAWIKEQREDKKQRDADRKRARRKDVLKWLRGSTALNESNLRHHRRGTAVLKVGSCEWLTKNSTFTAWLDKDSASQQPVLWLKAGPGTGKSVLCTYAAEHVRASIASSAIAFQYYSYDEQYSATQILRGLGEQLFDQLCSRFDDIPDDLHEHVQSVDNCDRVKGLIRLLVEKLQTVYIFLDGLDEECDRGKRWDDAFEALDFLTELAMDKPTSIRLWYSSQDRLCIRKHLGLFPTILVNELNNSDDIGAYLSGALPMLDSLDIDEGEKNMVLRDLKGRARGNFLWASLMVQTVSGAMTLADVQGQIQAGLPENYEKYYERKIASLEPSQRGLVSKILSCIAYARRPLQLEELCEAVGISNMEYNEDMSHRQKLFQSRVIDLCAPLVETETVGPRIVCTLSHSSVRNYLLKNPQILSTNVGGNSQKYTISNKELAAACLKYLLQPRYQQLLVKSGDSFETSSGEDIFEHHLLNYAAKYWDKHLDDVDYSQEWCDRVYGFLTSPQFRTCIQVQSLLIEGQFSFWMNRYHMEMGVQLKRVFPRWFDKRHNCGAQVSQQYYAFVGEWGYFLDEITSSRGTFTGEIERCLWGTLEPHSFLRSSKGHYKSFLFMDAEEKEDIRTGHYFEGVHSSGREVRVIRMQRMIGNPAQLLIRCQTWSLNGHRPKLQHTQNLRIPSKNWDLYDRPLQIKVIGRPPPVSFSSDLRFLRLGSCVLVESADGDYIPMLPFELENPYFEELAARESGRYLAVATRQKLSIRDLYSAGLHDKVMADVEDFFQALDELVLQEASQNASSSSGATSSNDRSTEDSKASTNSSATSLSIADAKEFAALQADNSESESFQLESGSDFSSSDEEEENDSARESWSEGSSAQSDGDGLDEDEHRWMDSASSVESLSIEDMDKLVDPDKELDVEEEVDEEDFESESSVKDEDNYAEVDGVPGIRLRRPSDAGIQSSEDEGFIESDDTQSSSDSNRDSSDEESDEETGGGGAKFEALLWGNRKKSPEGQRAWIQVYDTKTGIAVPIFRFSRALSKTLFNSPPVFHPSAPLVVWPIGKGEILFANFTEKSYFTRTLRCSTNRSCHVFIRASFSPCGGYLHLAALEAMHDPSVAQSDNPKPPLVLNLQVSTHRLSARKTARVPPKLIFRTNVPLGKSDSLAVSRPPHTLTWVAGYLYFTTSSQTLDVIRVPLFPDPAAPNGVSKPGAAAAAGSEVCSQNVYLPRSAKVRSVHYFPPGSDKKGSKSDQATVILGSQMNMPSQGGTGEKHDISPPAGFYLNEESQLGWEVMEGSRAEQGQKLKASAGRLQGKFEHFDHNEDCDLVPYLY